MRTHLIKYSNNFKTKNWTGEKQWYIIQTIEGKIGEVIQDEQNF